MRAACRSGAKVTATSNANPINEVVNLGTLGVLPNHGSFQIVHRGHNSRRCKHRFHESELQPNQAAIPHMGRWHKTKPDKHPELAVEVALFHSAYNKLSPKAPNTARETHIMTVTAMTQERLFALSAGA